MQETHIRVDLIDREWEQSIMRDEQETTERMRRAGCSIPRVQQVYSEIDESRRQCYEPLVVSIGPYHHGKPKLQEMEKFKAKMLREFVQESQVPLESFYKSITDVVGEARGCYDGEDETVKHIDDMKLAQMMVLDGCFVLQFIFNLVDQPEKLKMTLHVVELVQRDMFLLENQLPFVVLKSLIDLRSKYDGNKGMKLLLVYIKLMRGILPWSKRWNLELPENILELLIQKNPELGRGYHLLDLIHKVFCDRSEFLTIDRADDQKPGKKKHAISPSAKDDQLEIAGIRLRPLNITGFRLRPSRTTDFSDVKFEPSIFCGGELTIPPLQIDGTSKSVMLNMIAYETRFDLSGKEQWFTAYVCFMNSLIKDVNDVKILESNGILDISIQEKEVVDLFNEVAKNLVPDPLAFLNVRRQIEREKQSIVRKCVAECLNVYLSSPWKFIAVVAATIGLVLTAIQTYVAVFPPGNHNWNSKP